MTNIAGFKNPLSAEHAAIVSSLGLRSIVLVGMMGAGKTTIGLRLAAKLGISFVDTDDAVEVDCGMKIVDFFDKHGEPFFRAREAHVIAGLLRNPHHPQVLATGGGAFINSGTRAAIHANGFSIWLKVDFAVLMDRLQKSANRPLVGGEKFADDLKSLLREQNAYYRRADLTVEAGQVGPDVIVEKILENSKLIIRTLNDRRARF